MSRVPLFSLSRRRIGEIRLRAGDCLDVLRTLPAESVQCVITSPPYYNLRDYQVDGQLGMEPTPSAYVANLVRVFREVRRVLRADGTCWLVLGDSYAANRPYQVPDSKHRDVGNSMAARVPQGLKPKDLIGVPWRVAFALQADGYYLRSDIVFHKRNVMPESVTDRPTRAHEFVFLLTKSPSYFYDADAVREPLVLGDHPRTPIDMASHVPGASPHHGIRRSGNKQRQLASGKPGQRPADHLGSGIPWEDSGTGRNRRTVWTLATKPYRGAHFAVFPEALVEPCLKAGTSEHGCCASCGTPYRRQTSRTRTFESGSGRAGHLPSGKHGHLQGGGETLDVRRDPVVHTETLGWVAGCRCKAEVVPCAVLDPFAGSGTVGVVAQRLGRRAILIDLNLAYVRLMRERLVKGA